MKCENNRSNEFRFTLSAAQLAFLDKERESHISDKTEAYSWEEAQEIILKNLPI